MGLGNPIWRRYSRISITSGNYKHKIFTLSKLERRNKEMVIIFKDITIIENTV